MSFAPSAGSEPLPATLLRNEREAADFLGTTEGAPLLVLCLRPDQALARALASGVEIASAAQDCAAAMGFVLNLARLDPGRAVIIDHEAAVLRPAALAEALEQRLGLTFPALAGRAGASASAISPIYAGLALAYLRQHSELGGQLAEFAAASLPADTSPEIDWSAMLAGLTGLRQRADAAGREAVSAGEASLQADFELLARNEAQASRRNMLLLRELAEKDAALARRAESEGKPQDAKARKPSGLEAWLPRHLSGPLRWVRRSPRPKHGGRPGMSET